MRSVHQLTPELAAEIAASGYVVFIDAAVQQDTVVVQAIEPAPAAAFVTHVTDPRTLLGLVTTLGAPQPGALLVTIPAFDLGLGTSLSQPTRAAVAQAVALVEQRCTRR